MHVYFNHENCTKERELFTFHAKLMKENMDLWIYRCSIELSNNLGRVAEGAAAWHYPSFNGFVIKIKAVWKYSVERSHALRHLALAFISSQASHDALFSLK
ncbi:hypothetical protein RRG08_005469 [Elysia crispata]|uniref:Uncharacterized protein n=1 Tax=Elysia crispata TaxID=231223 RepID=A0AAE1CR77_9GAST|nr:hypothetical protein RRG08_005469 [Elysia crispata]